MQHSFSLAYLSVFGLPPPRMIGLAAATGYDMVGLRLHPVTDSEPVFALAQDPVQLRETKECLRNSPVTVLDVELIRLTPQFDIGTYEALLDVSAELGARHVIAQAPDPVETRASEHLEQLARAAATRGLSVNLEFVTWTETPDLDRAARIVAGSHAPNAGLLVDSLHFSRSNCSVTALAKLPRSWFRYAQLCDAPKDPPSSTDGLIHAARKERLFLGEGGLDLEGIIAALPPGLPLSLEIPRTRLARDIGLQECARLALLTARRFVQSLEAKAGARNGAANEDHARGPLH